MVDCRVQENVRSLGSYQCGGLQGVGECSVLRGLLVWWIAGCRRMFGPQGAISVVDCRVQENVRSFGGYQCGGLQGVGECSVLRGLLVWLVAGCRRMFSPWGLLVWWIAGCRRMFSPWGAINMVDCRVQENVRSLGSYQCGGLQGEGECSVLRGLLVWWIEGCRRMFGPQGAISVMDCRVQDNVRSLGGYQYGGLQGVGECSVLRELLVWWIAGCRRMFGPQGAISVVDCRVQENVRSLGGYQCGGLQGVGECSVLRGLLVWWIAGCRRMFGPQGAISVVGCRVQENVQSLGAISVVDCRVQENVQSLGGYQCGGLQGVGECSVLGGLLVWWIAGCRRMFGPQGAISVVDCRVKESVRSLRGYQCDGLQGVGECSVLRGLLVWWIAGCRRMFSPWGAISVVDCRMQENVQSLGGYQCGGLQGVGECSVLRELLVWWIAGCRRMFGPQGTISVVSCRVQENVQSLGGYQCGGLQGVGECSVLRGLLVWWIAGSRRMFSPQGAISVVDCRVQENVQSLGAISVVDCRVQENVQSLGAISVMDCRVQENVRSLGGYQCGGLQGVGECSVLRGLLVWWIAG